MKVKFSNVGRGNKTWTSEVGVDDVKHDGGITFLDAVESQIHLHGGLISSSIDIAYDIEKNGGSINAGFHTVGSFKVVKNKKKKS